MPVCPKCRNLNVKVEKDYTWCRNCGWSSDGKGIPQHAGGQSRG